MSVRDQNKKKTLLGQDNNALVLLLGANGFIFIILIFLRMAYSISFDTKLLAETAFQNDVLKWFIMPANLSELATRPWTLLTYMITHYSVWNMISTMLWLWAFGYIMQDLTGNKRIIPLYLYGGLIGGLLFLLSVNIFPAWHNNIQTIPPLIGGGAAVMAVVIGTTTLAPNFRMFTSINGGIPLWILTVVYAAIDLSQTSAAPGLLVAHMGAAAIGYLFIWQLKKGNDLGNWMYVMVDKINDFFSPQKKDGNIAQKERLYYNATQPPYTKTQNITQKRVDEILDKINQHGYHMLSDEEKKFLERAKEEL